MEASIKMRRFGKRGLAFLLAGVLIMETMLPVSAAEMEAAGTFAEQIPYSVSDNQLTQQSEVLPEEISHKDAVPDEETGRAVLEDSDKPSAQDGEGNVTDVPVGDGNVLSQEYPEEDPEEELLEETILDDLKQTEDTDGETAQTKTDYAAALEYLYVESPYVATPGTQRIVASAVGEAYASGNAFATIRNYRTGETIYAEGHAFDEAPNLYLFEAGFTDAAQSGIYQVQSITFANGSEESTVTLSRIGIYAYFGVNEEVVTSSDAAGQAFELDTNIVTIDSAGQTEAAADITEALERASAQLGGSEMARAGKSKKNIVVVLDPGHDATHAGARSGNLKEEELVLKIAKYCKEELLTYSGVTVYMTRETASCPHPGTTSVVCNSNRVAYAKSVGADVYVSIHLNSAGAAAKGAEVYYPNGSYNAEVSAKGKALAQSILSQLVSLGLSDRGVQVRNSGDGSVYPDGSIADYYGVIKNSKLNGFPGIIIEHAFLTNASDAALLSSEDGLARIGQADAQGIVNYYGLSHEEEAGDTEFTSDGITVGNVDLLAGTFTVSLENVSPADEVSKVQFKVYTKPDKSDMKVYNAKKQADGSYTATVSASKHGNVEGTYVIDAYVVDEDGNSILMGDATQELVPSFKAKLTAEVTGENNTNYTLSASGISGAQSVRFLFYYKKDGKAKGVYYRGKKDKAGVWNADIPLEKLVKEGNYKVYVYATAAYGEEKQAATKTFAYEWDMAASISVKATARTQKKFRVTVEGMAFATTMEYEVYSKTGGKDDLRTYKAVKDEDGAWIYNVPVKNHKTEGKYYVTVYATVGGKRVSIGKKTFQVSGPSAGKTTISQNTAEGTFTVNVQNVTSASGIDTVSVRVWTKKNQSDAKTFKAKLKKGTYTATVNLSKFAYYYGKYNIEVTALDNNKITKVVGTKKLTIAEPEASLQVAPNKAKTKYKVTVADLAYAKSMEIRVWRKGEGIRKARVYKAKLNSDDEWTCNVPLTAFSSDGKYYFRAFATLGSKSYQVASTTRNIQDVDNEEETDYYTIMGDGSVTLDQLMNYYKANATYPAFYADSDAPTLKKFCKLYISECEAEGVKVEVAFAQAMKETNFLRYGGDVSIEQYNFAGIGATGGGVPGNSFPNVKTGIRAQVQHLKAYASTEPLVHNVVDPRFAYVTRGISPYVEWLGVNENPNHVGWATDVGYGSNIVERIQTLKSY